jgi:hypothetical protein
MFIWLSTLLVYVTMGALHFFGHQARDLVLPHQSLYFSYHFTQLSGQAGRQADRQGGHCASFCDLFTL